MRLRVPLLSPGLVTLWPVRSLLQVPSARAMRWRALMLLQGHSLVHISDLGRRLVAALGRLRLSVPGQVRMPGHGLRFGVATPSIGGLV